MGQVIIDLEDELETKVRSAAKSMNLSVNQWLSNIIKENVREEWPDSVRELAGAWQDFPSLEEIRDFPRSDAPCEEL